MCVFFLYRNWYSTGTSTPFNTGTSWMYPIQKHNGTNAGDDALQENNDYDESEESNDMLQEHSM